MEVVNDTGLQISWVPWKVRPPEDSLTIIVKGTFRLSPGAAAELDPDDQSPPGSDAFQDDDMERSLRYENDFAHFKPRADLLLVGTCHPPGAAPVQSCRVSFGVGPLIKSLAVFGDRYWTKTAGGVRASDPVPFAAMPLCYENGFGGAGFDRNPVGKGAGRVQLVDGREIWPLPNIEDPRQRVRSPQDRPAPCGFGPRGRACPERRALIGTLDRRWNETRAPWYPDDFDWGFFNAAPGDQQVEGYLRGDEPLYFENLHPEYAEYRAKLPGLRVRCFLHQHGEDHARQGREVRMDLDTLWVDMDAAKLVLVWRGLAAVRSQAYDEIKEVLVAAESLSEDPLPAQAYYARFSQAALIDETETQASVPAAENSSDPVDVDTAQINAEVDAEVSQVLEQMRERFTLTHLDLDRIKSLVLASDPAAAIRDYALEQGADPGEVDRAIAQAERRTADLLAQHGFDPDLLKDEPDQSGQPPAAQIRGRIAAGEGLSGLDQTGADLAGAELSGADLAGGDFSGANLQGANLAGANLSGTAMRGARLSKAILSGAALDGADLAGAQLDRANLAGASLVDADVQGAELARADLKEVSAQRANFSGADLTDTDLRNANLESADFSRCRLDRATFDEASLRGAVLSDAAGVGVSMEGADLTGLLADSGCRFPKGRFHRISAVNTLWQNANLAGAEFTAADMAGAVFAGANLEGVDFDAADLKNGNLSGARLASARITRANLFRANLSGADLNGADFGSSNLFEAEFQEAVVAGARFAGANLKRTRLDPARGGGRQR